MSTKRAALVVLGLVLIAGLLVGCAPQSEEATFIGYKMRPTEDTAGVAIIQLPTGEPAEAEITLATLENGAPVRIVKKGENYTVLSVHPDWK